MVRFDLLLVEFGTGIGEWEAESNAGTATPDGGRPDRVPVHQDQRLVSLGETGAARGPDQFR
jgi:hypothetical protein